MMYNIGNVKVDVSFYKGVDNYSDGDIEEEILEITKNDKDIIDILHNDSRWPILYHLSPQRTNLLDWYEFNRNSNLLEIGAGCGALTGLFCDKVDNVVAIEMSKRRAEIIANRHKNCSNLEIVVGNFEDIKLNSTFDYITLIGVLEYSGKFIDGEDPYVEMLKKVRGLLSDKGTLIIAIENKFGLKYWAGAPEDHTGEVFDGLTGYLKSKDIATFGKEEISKMIKEAGFGSIQFYYPVPDYKMPDQIFSEDYLPDISQMNYFNVSYDRSRVELFNEKTVYQNLIRNDKYDFFANSFLLICNR